MALFDAYQYPFAPRLESAEAVAKSLDYPALVKESVQVVTAAAGQPKPFEGRT